MTADTGRDGQWALAALRRTFENGGGSESVGCRIDALVGGDIKMNREFSDLLLKAIDAGWTRAPCAHEKSKPVLTEVGLAHQCVTCGHQDFR